MFSPQGLHSPSEKTEPTGPMTASAAMPPPPLPRRHCLSAPLPPPPPPPLDKQSLGDVDPSPLVVPNLQAVHFSEAVTAENFPTSHFSQF